MKLNIRMQNRRQRFIAKKFYGTDEPFTIEIDDKRLFGSFFYALCLQSKKALR